MNNDQWFVLLFFVGAILLLLALISSALTKVVDALEDIREAIRHTDEASERTATATGER